MASTQVSRLTLTHIPRHTDWPVQQDRAAGSSIARSVSSLRRRWRWNYLRLARAVSNSSVRCASAAAAVATSESTRPRFGATQCRALADNRYGCSTLLGSYRCRLSAAGGKHRPARERERERGRTCPRFLTMKVTRGHASPSMAHETVMDCRRELVNDMST